jgi:hypothetical protein
VFSGRNANPPTVPLYVSSPFPHQIQSPARQLALNYLEVTDVNGGFELTVSSVKMRWRMVIVKHADQDPIEHTDRGHLGEVDSIIWQGYSPQGQLVDDNDSRWPNFVIREAGRHPQTIPMNWMGSMPCTNGT